LVQTCHINLDLLEKIPNKIIMKWMPFLELFRSSIAKYNNLSTSGPNKLSWRYLKIIVNNILYLNNFNNIVNACIYLGHWLSHSKMLLFIIIPKPNKTFYNSPMAFRSIVLLDMLGKLIEKVIGKRLQF